MGSGGRRQKKTFESSAKARARAGRNPVRLKWIDTNKGSGKAPRYRSRLVCTKVLHKGVEPILSATPPLEALRILLCVACQEDISRVEDPFLIYFYADAVRDVYVRLPDETQKQRSQTYVESDNNGGENSMHMSWRRKALPEARRLRVTSS